MNRWWLVLGVLGCSTPPPEPAPPPPPAAPSRSVTVEPKAAETSMQVNGGDAVPVQLRFTTVGMLHQGYFSQPPLVQRLGRGLGRCTTHTVEVDVVWSQADLEGRIIGAVPAATTGCMPTSGSATVDLRPLVPLSSALATYRDDVAGSSDLRVSNFVVGLDIARAGMVCRLVATGQHPPDGTRFHPCVQVNGDKVCGAGDAEKGVESLRFTDPAAAAKAMPCFGS